MSFTKKLKGGNTLEDRIAPGGIAGALGDPDAADAAAAGDHGDSGGDHGHMDMEPESAQQGQENYILENMDAMDSPEDAYMSSVMMGTQGAYGADDPVIQDAVNAFKDAYAETAFADGSNVEEAVNHAVGAGNAQLMMAGISLEVPDGGSDYYDDPMGDPMGEEPPPVAEEPPPVAEEPPPVAEEPPPVAEEPPPVAEEPPPVAEEPHPVAEEPVSVDEEPHGATNADIPENDGETKAEEPPAEEPPPVAEEPPPVAEEPPPVAEEPVSVDEEPHGATNADIPENDGETKAEEPPAEEPISVDDDGGNMESDIANAMANEGLTPGDAFSTVASTTLADDGIPVDVADEMIREGRPVFEAAYAESGGDIQASLDATKLALEDTGYEIPNSDGPPPEGDFHGPEGDVPPPEGDFHGPEGDVPPPPEGDFHGPEGDVPPPPPEGDFHGPEGDVPPPPPEGDFHGPEGDMPPPPEGDFHGPEGDVPPPEGDFHGGEGHGPGGDDGLKGEIEQKILEDGPEAAEEAFRGGAYDALMESGVAPEDATAMANIGAEAFSESYANSGDVGAALEDAQKAVEDAGYNIPDDTGEGDIGKKLEQTFDATLAADGNVQHAFDVAIDEGMGYAAELLGDDFENHESNLRTLAQDTFSDNLNLEKSPSEAFHLAQESVGDAISNIVDLPEGDHMPPEGSMP